MESTVERSSMGCETKGGNERERLYRSLVRAVKRVPFQSTFNVEVRGYERKSALGLPWKKICLKDPDDLEARSLVALERTAANEPTSACLSQLTVH